MIGVKGLVHLEVLDSQIPQGARRGWKGRFALAAAQVGRVLPIVIPDSAYHPRCLQGARPIGTSNCGFPAATLPLVPSTEVLHIRDTFVRQQSVAPACAGRGMP